MTSPENCIAVTGGTGFIGRSVLRQLSALGLPVRALTRRAQPGAEPGIQWIVGDLNDGGALDALVTGAMAVVHLAGLTKAPSRAALYAANADAAGRIAGIAAAAGVQRFIHVSSLAAREAHLSDYAGSKRAGEDAVRAAAGPMEVVVVRPPAIIGPDDPATAQLLGMMRRGRLLAPGGWRRQKTRLSFMDVDDIAAYLISLRQGPLPAGAVEPTAEVGGVGWDELAQTAARVLSKPVRVVPLPPAVLFSAASVVQGALGLFGQSSFFNTGKVREILHTDWTGSTVVAGARELEATLARAFELDESK